MYVLSFVVPALTVHAAHASVLRTLAIGLQFSRDGGDSLQGWVHADPVRPCFGGSRAGFANTKAKSCVFLRSSVIAHPCLTPQLCIWPHYAAYRVCSCEQSCTDVMQSVSEDCMLQCERVHLGDQHWLRMMVLIGTGRVSTT